MQNIPAEESYRSCFIPQDGYTLIVADYNQQEYRLAGAVSGEPAIINAYLSGADMHSATASIIFSIPLQDVTPEQRRLGKVVNFAILYGSTDLGLAKNLKISPDRAREIIASFEAGYPRLTAFRREVEDRIWRYRFSTTLLGRRRYFPKTVIFQDGKEASRFASQIKREGFNHLIQGTGADVTKIAMVRLFRNSPWSLEKFRVLLQVHDEIVVEASSDIADDAAKFVEYEMAEAIRPFLGEIPAAVEVRMGKYWQK